LEYERQLEIEENRFILYDDFSEDVFKKQFAKGMRYSIIHALISASEMNTVDALNMSNISENVSQAIQTGNMRSFAIMDENFTFYSYMNRSHFSLAQYHTSYYNFTHIHINHSDWENISVYYNATYKLGAVDIEFSNNFSDSLIIPVIGIYTEPFNPIRPNWEKNTSNDCVIKILDPNYNCGLIAGISDS
jgi:hypothetical protein